MSDHDQPTGQPSEPHAWSATSANQAQFTQNPYGEQANQQPVSEQAPTAPQQTVKATRTGVGDFVTEQASDGPQIQQYRRGSLWTIIIPLAVLLAAAALVWYGTRPPEVPSGASTPSSTITPYRQRTPTATSTGLPAQMDFINNRVEGTFYVDSSEWNGDELTVQVRVEVRQGSLNNYRFMAMDVKNGGVLRQTSTSGEISQANLSAGQSASGTVTFRKERGETQVVLTDSTNSGSLAIVRVPG